MNKEKYDEHWTDAPIGIIQAGGIRTTINETDHDGKNIIYRYFNLHCKVILNLFYIATVVFELVYNN